MIRIESLSKSYDGRAILSGVTAEFHRGDVTCLLGPSGCGKSTLLRCINGLERFDAGAIHVGGETLHPDSDASVRAAVRRKVGFIFQQWNLFAHRTALGNVMEAPVHVRKVPAREARERALDLLNAVGLGHRTDAYPREMSGGEQQRVAIARALAMAPEVLLLDEPTSALDPSRKAEVLGVLQKLARGGMTMVLVTHELAVARAVASRVLTLGERGAVSEPPPIEPRDSARGSIPLHDAPALSDSAAELYEGTA